MIRRQLAVRAPRLPRASRSASPLATGRHARWPGVAGVLAAALLTSGCADDATDNLDRAASPIIGGAVDEGDPAVVMLVAYAPDHSVFDTCTASVIAEDVLLTAAHCLDPATHPDYGFGVFTGADASAYPTANTLLPKLVSVKEVHMHPDYDPLPPFTADVGVVLLDAPLDVAPLPIWRDPVTADIAKTPARIVGYGQTTYKLYNAVRHAASTSVVGLDKGDTITVGDKDHRSCIGDSGGPALVESGGVEKIIGVDSYTELAGCLDPAHYRRPDLYTSFIDTYAPPPSAGGAGGGGAGGSPSGGGDTSSPKSGGCALAGDSPSATPSLTALLVLAAALLRARRRSRRSPQRCSPERHATT